jgi:predicted transcriptional regulator YheO
VALPGAQAGTAVGVVLAGAKGAPRGLLAITFDRSPLVDAVTLIGTFAAPPAPPQPQQPAAVAVWAEQIGAVVAEESRAAGLRTDRLTRLQRLALVRALDERGLFSTRHATAHAARALGVSRTTVYDLLKEARS